MRAWLLAFGLVGSGLVGASTNDAFDRLGETLVGEWVSRPADDGREVRVDYRRTARGTVLVETWQPGTPGETVSVFHRDGGRVLATHYCAQGNQPRLALRDGAGTSFVFEYVDATGLADPARSHLHHLELVPRADGGLERVETYRTRGTDTTTRRRFTRNGAAGH